MDAYHLPTGTIIVVRAPQTAAATGGAHYMRVSSANQQADADALR